MAVTALDAQSANVHFITVSQLAADPSEPVRAAAAEKLGLCGSRGLKALATCESDAAATVREATATAYGEIGDASALGWLADAASSDGDRQVREAAVAAIGAIGHPDGIDPLLALIADGPPQVRRRAIAAITVFDDPRVEPAIRRAALDRNPGVKEAAEMIVGRQIREA
ncbi:MAG: HEAT repeat domain-containing protein [Acidimicrobiia bacterium]|nr:HEAT repeat domain-containing protein [Acidimicrobiia bacterium]